LLKDEVNKINTKLIYKINKVTLLKVRLLLAKFNSKTTIYIYISYYLIIRAAIKSALNLKPTKNTN